MFCQFYLNLILQYVTLVFCLYVTSGAYGFLNERYRGCTRFTTHQPPTEPDEPKCPRRTEMDEAIFAAHDALSHREVARSTLCFFLKKKRRFIVTSVTFIEIATADSQCMAYLPTFTINNYPHVGRYTIHWVFGNCFWVKVSRWPKKYDMYIFIFLGGRGKHLQLNFNIIYTYNSERNVKTNLCFLDHGGEICAPCAKTTRPEQTGLKHKGKILFLAWPMGQL